MSRDSSYSFGLGGPTWNGIPLWGGGSIPTMFGTHWFVDFVNGLDGNSGKSMRRPVKTLSRAYALATGGRNDVAVVNGNSTVSAYECVEEDAMITWAKNKIHTVGLGGFGATDMSPRIIFSTAGKLVDAAAVLKVTGWANTFTNLRINNWSTHGNAVTALWDAGEANTYSNCQFNMFENLGETTSSDVEARGDSTTWRGCKFGFDTLEVTAARQNLFIKGTGASARMKNNVFEDCLFIMDSSVATAAHIRVYDGNSLAFMNIWKNCIMAAPIITSLGTAVLTNAVISHASANEGSLMFYMCSSNAANFCSAQSTGVTNRVVTYAPATSATGGETGTPT